MEQNEDKIYYKIEAGRKYRIFKNTFNDKNFYKIQVTQKNYDGTTMKFYKAVTFKRGVEVPNETDIIIHKAFENLRENKNDKYEPISYLMITDFEIVENQEKIQEKAFADYQETLDNDDWVDIDNFLD